MGLPRTVSASDYHDDAYKFFSAKLKIYRATFK